ncbi:hypothetical protein [Lactobacillus delbrueckii]|uniref:hypothetical protein n=1 Tax=Lactobacillus delbrueckii TaxID=1584 RepID=UPI001F192E5D|nr:hypothetical protein [Lactobacillus delbrueckii]GHN50777.1 hypothetical protein ME801_04460 [Lactobacillus delbrueckii]
MKINAKGISYQFSDSDGSTQSITINLSGSDASDYISGLFAIKSSDLTDSTTLDSLNKTQITALGLKKMEAYVKAALSEA